MIICKDRGWGKKSATLLAKKSDKYYERTNIIAGLLNNKSIAPMVFNGTCNTDFFNHWVEHFLITFHKSEKTQKLIESVDCKVIFLTHYSPDLNPTEKFWAYMKDGLNNTLSVVMGYLRLLMNSLIDYNSTAFTI